MSVTDDESVRGDDRPRTKKGPRRSLSFTLGFAPKLDQSRGPAARIASLAPASNFLKLSTKNFASFLAVAS